MQEIQQASPAGAGQQAGQHAQQAIIQPNRFDAVKALPPALNLAAPATAEDMKSLKAYVDAMKQYAAVAANVDQAEVDAWVEYFQSHQAACVTRDVMAQQPGTPAALTEALTTLSNQFTSVRTEMRDMSSNIAYTMNRLATSGSDRIAPPLTPNGPLPAHAMRVFPRTKGRLTTLRDLRARLLFSLYSTEDDHEEAVDDELYFGRPSDQPPLAAGNPVLRQRAVNALAVLIHVSKPFHEEEESGSELEEEGGKEGDEEQLEAAAAAAAQGAAEAGNAAADNAPH